MGSNTNPLVIVPYWDTIREAKAMVFDMLRVISGYYLGTSVL